jgi:hypothetical protein
MRAAGRTSGVARALGYAVNMSRAWRAGVLVVAVGAALAVAPTSAAVADTFHGPAVIVFNNSGKDSGNDSVTEIDRTLNLNRGLGSAGSDNEEASTNQGTGTRSSNGGGDEAAGGEDRRALPRAR